MATPSSSIVDNGATSRHYSRCPATFKALGAPHHLRKASPDTTWISWPVLPPPPGTDLEGEYLSNGLMTSSSRSDTLPHTRNFSPYVPVNDRSCIQGLICNNRFGIGTSHAFRDNVVLVSHSLPRACLGGSTRSLDDFHLKFLLYRAPFFQPGSSPWRQPSLMKQ